MIQKFLLLLLFTSCASYNFKPIILPEGQTYKVINSGKIHRNCLEKFGQTIIDVIDESSSKGLACLKNLNGKGSQKNYVALSKLFASKKITYSCVEEGDFWKKFNYEAYASVDNDSNNKEYGLFHPFVSINPNSVMEFSGRQGNSRGPEILKEILFHENFHLIGYRHGYSLEYAYACESCCFPAYGGDVDAACKICATDYKNISDNLYLNDMWEWSGKSYYKKGMLREQLLRMMMMQKPSSDPHLRRFFETDFTDNMVKKFVALKLPPKDYTEVYREKTFGPYNDALVPLARQVADLEDLLYLKGKFHEAMKMALNLNVEILSSYMDDNVSVLLWASIMQDMGVMKEKLRVEKKPDWKKVQAKMDLVVKYGEKIKD